MKHSYLMAFAVAALSACVWTGMARAEAAAADSKESKKDVKTISGTSACATCSGVTTAGHNIMITDKKGMRWVLMGDSESYKKAHKVRDDGKKMTATLAGEPVVKKDDKGKEYKEVKVSDIKVEV